MQSCRPDRQSDLEAAPPVPGLAEQWAWRKKVQTSAEHRPVPACSGIAGPSATSRSAPATHSAQATLPASPLQQWPVAVDNPATGSARPASQAMPPCADNLRWQCARCRKVRMSERYAHHSAIITAEIDDRWVRTNTGLPRRQRLFQRRLARISKQRCKQRARNSIEVSCAMRNLRKPRKIRNRIRIGRIAWANRESCAHRPPSAVTRIEPRSGKFGSLATRRISPVRSKLQVTSGSG